MAVSLYRKYRPQIFTDVIGQDSIVTTLAHQSARREFAHAYLFTGPRGVGKTTLARIVAKAANCEHPKKNGNPDNTCTSCTIINEGKALDVMEIDAASHTGVDNVRTAIIDTTRIHPSQLTYKVFIIDEVHMLSTSAFNALLKTLEEPPEHVLFVLATTEIHKVPDTIISRCQRFAFHRIAHGLLVGRLQEIAKRENVKVDDSVLERIASRAEGSSRDAESLLGQLLSLEKKHITSEEADMVLPRSTFEDVSAFIHLLVQKNITDALAFVEQFAESGGHPQQFLDDCIAYTRSLLLVKQQSKKINEFLSKQFPEKVVAQMNKDEGLLTPQEIVGMIETFIHAKKAYWYPPLPQIAIELSVFEIVGDDASTHSEKSDGESAKNKIQFAEPNKPAKQQPSIQKSMEAPLAKLTATWQDVTNAVRKENRGLSLSVQAARPVDISEDVITLAVPYIFHKERIEVKEHTRLLSEIISKHLSQPYRIRCVVQDLPDTIKSAHANVEKVKTDSLWDQVVDAFGDQTA